jgi:hypothetical protein
MSAVRRMKYEMTLKERARRQEVRASLTPSDRAEVEHFKELLADWGKVPLPELIQRHGAAYLGFTAAEVDAIEARAKEVQS